MFYHYLELHHSQTVESVAAIANAVLPLSGITSLSNIRPKTLCAWQVLPLSGITSLSNRFHNCYRSFRVLPLSGITSLSNSVPGRITDFRVLPLSGITSLSNLKFQSQFAYLLKSSTSKTAITWQCNSDMVKIYSKI